jgi:hypothetical protein
MGCSPQRGHWMDEDTAVEIWRQLQSASPHGCKIHLSGGEIFGDWPRLISLVRRAKAEGLVRLEKVETNGFWLADEDEACRRIEALGEAGMEFLAISADPFHQHYVPLEQVRRLAELGRKTLGPTRVQVRWEEWMENGEDLTAVTPEHRNAVFAKWLTRGYERINGRAAEELAGLMERKPIDTFRESICRKSLLRGKHIHVNPDGTLTPGVCAGILLGSWGSGEESSIAANWQRLKDEYDSRPIVSTLATGGPVALAEQAAERGFVIDPRGYVSKCHLCWSLRKWLFAKGLGGEELGPAWLYGI